MGKEAERTTEEAGAEGAEGAGHAQDGEDAGGAADAGDVEQGGDGKEAPPAIHYERVDTFTKVHDRVNRNPDFEQPEESQPAETAGDHE